MFPLVHHRRRRAVSPSYYNSYNALAGYGLPYTDWRSGSPPYGYPRGYGLEIEIPNTVETATRAHAAAQAECEKLKEKYEEAKKKFEESEKKMKAAEDALRVAKYAVWNS
jgi:hypothetical protein